MSADDHVDIEYIERYRDAVQYPLWQLFQRYGHGNRRWFLVGILASIGSRFASLVPPVLLGVAIDAIFGNEPFELPLIPRTWLPQGEQLTQFWFAIGLMAVFMIGQALLNFVRASSLNLFSHRVKHEVRTASYQRMQRLDITFFNEVQTGELMSILSNDTNRLERFLDNMFGESIQLGVLIVGISVILFWYNPQLAAVTLSVIPLAAVFTYWFMRLAEERYADVRQSVGDLNSRLENNLSGIEVVKAFTTEAFESERVADSSGEHRDARWSARRWGVRFGPGLTLISGMGFAVVFVVGGWWLVFDSFLFFSGPITVGTLVLSLQYAQRITGPMSEAGILLNNYERVKASAERVYVLKDYPPNVPEVDDAVDLGAVEGRVAFEDVSFAYDADTGFDSDASDDEADSRSLFARLGLTSADEDRETTAATDDTEPEQALTDIDFTADAGEMIGLVGPTGSGKSTLMKLLMRFYDVDEGAVRVDDHDVREVSINSLRGSIGYVSQEPFLFTGTVRDNIAYGMSATDEEIREAAEVANAHEFITALEDGYDTEVGQEGDRLSGGQRQRVAIARVVLKDPEIIVLDEATSHVDNETEVLIQRSLGDLIEERTTFAIAHRLSTVRNADRILVLEDGEVVERGTHEDLLDRDGLYANLWSVQVGEVDALPEEFLEQAAARDRA